MDDVAEQQEIANEISDAISNPVGFGQDVDDVRNRPLSFLFEIVVLIFPCFSRGVQLGAKNWFYFFARICSRCPFFIIAIVQWFPLFSVRGHFFVFINLGGHS